MGAVVTGPAIVEQPDTTTVIPPGHRARVDRVGNLVIQPLVFLGGVFTGAALAAGVAINPGPQWSVNKEHSRSRLRLCFASPSHEEINQGVAALAEVCRQEFGMAPR